MIEKFKGELEHLIDEGKKEEGERRAKEIARNLIEIHTLEEISKATGLTIAEINKL